MLKITLILAFLAVLLWATLARAGEPEPYMTIIEERSPVAGSEFWGKKVTSSQPSVYFKEFWQGKEWLAVFYELNLHTKDTALLLRVIALDSPETFYDAVCVVSRLPGTKTPADLYYEAGSIVTRLSARPYAAFFKDLDGDGAEELLVAVGLESDSYLIVEAWVFDFDQKSGVFKQNGEWSSRLARSPQVNALSGSSDRKPIRHMFANVRKALLEAIADHPEQ